MAEKSSMSKSKNVITNVSSEDERDEVTTGHELELPLDKLSLGPKKKLLILCLDGLLIQRVYKLDFHIFRRYEPDLRLGNFLVFIRPYCIEFMKFCFERFDVALWSSAMQHNIDGLLSDVTGGGDMQSKLLFVWGQKECTNSGYKCLHNPKPLFFKELKCLWGSASYKDKYSASNTLLIDAEPHTCLLNPPNTSIFPEVYTVPDSSDTDLGPNGELRGFLNGLADAGDVPTYVRDHRIGRPLIAESHPDWNYYARIVRWFR